MEARSKAKQAVEIGKAGWVLIGIPMNIILLVRLSSSPPMPRYSIRWYALQCTSFLCKVIGNKQIEGENLLLVAQTKIHENKAWLYVSHILDLYTNYH